MILLRPVPHQFRITQHFGENPNIYPLTNGHNGIDFGTPEGTPVMAAADGVVTRVELDTTTAVQPNRGYGYNVRILHPDGSTSIYAHFQKDAFLVATGDNVKMGTILGRSGNTGFSTGPHLHFEVRLGAAATTAINTEAFLVDEIPSSDILFNVTVAPEGDGVRLRVGPGTNFGIVRQLHTDDKMDVFGLAGNNVWLRVKDGYVMYDPKWYKVEKAGDGG
ncbi:MAG: peptidoglycan DD-metalloendopeptidase family protein [Chloroflexi bacterium]|nr:peptidoglycan DD-metalloendopeptidase family protein [Chloroflexota bacterium]